MRGWSLALWGIGALAACESLDASHPLDPDSPRSRQAKGTVLGRLVLPAEGDAAALAAAVVTLTADGASVAAHRGDVESTGAFRVARITPGVYALAVEIEGFAAPARRIDVGIAATEDVGEVLLVDTTPDGRVTGAVRLAGQDRHDGVLVDNGAGASDTSNADGEYALTLRPGAWRLRLRYPGYHTAEVEVTVAPGATVDAEPVELLPRAGSVRGTVALRRFDGADRRSAVRIEVLDASGATVATSHADAEGAFEAPSLAPGAVRVRAAVAGFEAVERALTIPPGAAADAGELSLEHLSHTDRAVPFVVRVRAAGLPVMGAAVEVAFADFEGILGAARTNAAGEARVIAAPDEIYDLRVTGEGLIEYRAGVYRWVQSALRFEDEAGDGPTVELERPCAPDGGACALGSRCDPEAGRCTAGCGEDADCATDAWCDLPAGACAPGCRASADCPFDNSCLEHVCTPD